MRISYQLYLKKEQLTTPVKFSSEILNLTERSKVLTLLQARYLIQPLMQYLPI